MTQSVFKSNDIVCSFTYENNYVKHLKDHRQPKNNPVIQFSEKSSQIHKKIWIQYNYGSRLVVQIYVCHLIAETNINRL